MMTYCWERKSDLLPFMDLLCKDADHAELQVESMGATGAPHLLKASSFIKLSMLHQFKFGAHCQVARGKSRAQFPTTVHLVSVFTSATYVQNATNSQWLYFTPSLHTISTGVSENTRCSFAPAVCNRLLFHVMRKEAFAPVVARKLNNY